MNDNYFIDFQNAAEALYDVLPVDRMQEEEWVLISTSLKAIPMVDALAKKMKLYYDILFMEPIFSPNNESCIIGCVSETQEIVTNTDMIDSFDISLDFVYSEAYRRYEDIILKQIYRYRKGESILSLKDKNVLFIDLGCETGLHAMTAIKTANKQKAKLVGFATPVLALDVASQIDAVTDEFFCVFKPKHFVDMEFYYKTSTFLSADELFEFLKTTQFYLPFKN